MTTATTAEPKPEPTIIRITVFFKRKPGLTEEEFNYHWEKIHAPLVIPWALRFGFINYTEFHTPSTFRSKSSDPSRTLDFDDGADFYVRDYESYKAAFKDPWYVNVIEPDERRFIMKENTDKDGWAVGSMVSTIGFCREIVSNGEAVRKV